MAWSRSLRMALFGGAVCALFAVCGPVISRAAGPASPDMKEDAPAAPARSTGTGAAAPGTATPTGGVDGYAGPSKHKMTSAELGRLRMLEIKSGAYRDAKAVAGSTALVGPPLSDREKV